MRMSERDRERENEKAESARGKTEEPKRRGGKIKESPLAFADLAIALTEDTSVETSKVNCIPFDSFLSYRFPSPRHLRGRKRNKRTRARARSLRMRLVRRLVPRARVRARSFEVGILDRRSGLKTPNTTGPVRPLFFLFAKSKFRSVFSVVFAGASS